MKISGDRKRNLDPTEITWTTKAPQRARVSPENIMTKPAALSEEAKAAVTEEDLWSLFFSQQILDEIVTWTNQKIEARILEKNYTAETLKKSPHMSTTDEVPNQFFH